MGLMPNGSLDRIIGPVVGVMFVGGAVAWVFVAPLLHIGGTSPPDWLTLGAGAVLAYYFGRDTQRATGEQLTNGINTVIQKAQQAVRAPSRATDATPAQPPPSGDTQS